MILAAVITTLTYACLCALWPAMRFGQRRSLYWSAALLVLTVWVFARWLGGRLALPAGWLVSTWLATSVISALSAVALLLLRWISAAGRRWFAGSTVHAPPDRLDESRRRFLGGGAVLPGVALSIGAGGAAGGAGDFVVRHVELRLPGLPRAFDGFRIGQITDVHIGDFIRPEYLERAVEALNSANVHLQVMTGDLIDDLSLLDPTMAALGRCRAPHGMLAILGNHEKFRDIERVLDAYERHARGSSVRLLVDDSVVLEHGGARLRVVGVDYPMLPRRMSASRKEPRAALMRVSAEKAFRSVRAGEALICLSHHPEFFPFAAERGALLTLAGHTHGGQIAFLGRPLLQTYEYMLGLYRRGGAQLYVSPGTGHWLPFRVGVPTEVTVLTLRSASR